MLKKAYKNKKNTGMSTHTHRGTSCMLRLCLSLSVGESAQRESDSVCVFVV